MKDAIMIFAVFVQMLFWCVCGIVGYTFGGSDDSPIFKIVVAFFSALACLIFVLSLLRKEIPFNKTFWICCIFLPLLSICIYYIETGMFHIGGRLKSTVLFMSAFCFPAIIEAIYIAQKGIASFAKWIDIIMVIVTIAMLSSSIQALAGITSIGGASYQIMSYYSAFAFCTNLCMIFWGNKYERFAIFNAKNWEIISFSLLFVQLMGCLISGGRGGFVVLALCSLYILLKAGKIGKMASLGIFAVIFLFSVSFLFPENPVYNKLEKSTQRTFNYLNSDDSGTTTNTTGRENLYGPAWEYAQEHNFLGAGLFNANNDFGFYPHNIILEMLIQGGALYLLLWMIVWIAFAYKLLYLIKVDDANIIIPLAFYAILSLMFSGSYLETHNYWFVITYVFCRSELIKIQGTHL